MSFGFSPSDVALLAQLCWSTVQGARKACGEYDELTQEVLSLHAVLDQLQAETSDLESLLRLNNDKRKSELEKHISGCEGHLRDIDKVLKKCNALSDEERSMKRLWQQFRFGNGPVQDMSQIRSKISTYTAAISMSLHLVSLGSQGRMERRLSRQGGDLQGIRESVNFLVAKFTATPEGSVMTAYSNDDKTVWRALRRELVKDGYRSKAIQEHKGLIQAYVKELSDRGVLDDRLGQSQSLVGSLEASIEEGVPLHTNGQDYVSNWANNTSTSATLHVNNPINTDFEETEREDTSRFAEVPSSSAIISPQNRMSRDASGNHRTVQEPNALDSEPELDLEALSNQYRGKVETVDQESEKNNYQQESSHSETLEESFYKTNGVLDLESQQAHEPEAPFEFSGVQDELETIQTGQSEHPNNDEQRTQEREERQLNVVNDIIPAANTAAGESHLGSIGITASIQASAVPKAVLEIIVFVETRGGLRQEFYCMYNSIKSWRVSIGMILSRFAYTNFRIFANS